MKTTAADVRAWRARAAISQAQAADLIGVSRATYLGLEAGVATLRTVQRWAKVAGMTLELRGEGK